jgi:hypothetical protein
LTRAIDPVPRGLLAPSTIATRDRIHAHLDAIEGRIDDADGRFHAAAQVFEELEMPFERAVVILERVERLGLDPVGSDADLSDALRTFGELGAKPWIERAAALDATAR